MPTPPKENLLRTLRRQGFEQVPLDPSWFCASQLAAFKQRFGHDDYRRFFGTPFRPVEVPVTRQFTDGRALYRRERLPDDLSFDDLGVGHSVQPGCYHMTRMHHPLKGEEVTLAEIRAHPLPVLAADAEAALRAQHEALTARGLASLCCMACTVWEGAWYLRSMEDLMMDMMGEDERAVLLLDRVTEYACQRIRAAARAGCDIIQLGDDIGMQSTPMMAVPMWEKWLKPRLAKIIAAGREIRPGLLIFYHSCGYVLPFIDGLIDAGIDILNPVQPECMSFEEVHGKFGDRLSFWSTIGTQTTLPFGTPAQVREAVWANLRVCGKRGGIVIGPTHMVEPEVPWENLIALKEACESFPGAPG